MRDGRDAKIWGATEDEVAARYPCDALGIVHDDVYFRAIAVAAPRPLVFRWLCQLRVAPYSYDWLDNFGRRSPRQLTPGADRLAPGQPIMSVFRLLGFERDESLTIAAAPWVPAAIFGNFAGTYRVGEASTGTRLVAKVLVRYPRGPLGRLAAAITPSVDLFMFRKQLETLRDYAERDAAEVRHPNIAAQR